MKSVADSGLEAGSLFGPELEACVLFGLHNFGLEDWEPLWVLGLESKASRSRLVVGLETGRLFGSSGRAGRVFGPRNL